MVQSIDPAALHDATEPYGSNVTAGSWDTEEASVAALDEALERAALWTVHREVRGTLAQPRPSQVDRGMRIDRILVPTGRLTSLGWRHGIIGIEAKKSGVKIGPPIAQAMDYSRTIWTLPHGFSVWLDWVFVWPMQRPSGAVESICAQHRIGHAHSTDWHLLRLQCGAFNVIDVDRNGVTRLGTAYALPGMGKRAGSR